MEARKIFVTVVATVVLLHTFAYADNWVPGEIILKTAEPINIAGYGEGTGYAEIDALNSQYGVYEMARLHDDELLFGGPVSHPRGLWDWNDWCTMVATYEFDTYYVFKYSAPVDPPEVAATYSSLTSVDLATADWYAEYHYVPKDPLFTEQWHLDNTGQYGGTRDCDIHAVEAWDIFPYISEPVQPPPEDGFPKPVLAIIDSGVDLEHPDLIGNMVPGRDIADQDDEPEDWFGHGTQVSGVACASTNNLSGEPLDWEGIASPGVNYFDFMMLKVSHEGDDPILKPVLGAMIWGAKHGAEVENMSFGWYTRELHEDLLKALEKTCEGVYYLGVVMVASAGNDGFDDQNDPLYPADFEEVIKVGGTDGDDYKWVESNFGDNLECVAPAVDIFTTYHSPWYDYSPEWDMFGGTSASAPLVSAVCMLISKELEPTNPPSARIPIIRQILHDSCDNVNGGPAWDRNIGWGRINLRKMAEIIYGVRGNTENSESTNGEKKAISDMSISTASPNPTSGETCFAYTFSGKYPDKVKLDVYDITGRKVSAEEPRCLGAEGVIKWDAGAAGVGPGVYIARISAGEFSEAVKFVVAK